MDYRRLGKSGLRVPALSFGTGTFGGGNDFFKAWGNTDATGAARLVDICLDHGVNLFDSADVYSDGLAEQILGAAIKGKRHRLLISTKATFPTGDGANDFGSSRQHLIDAVDKALQRLGTDYIDLFQFHQVTEVPDPNDPNGAWYTTGVRIGTPALTSRGFGADEFDKVSELVVDVLKNASADAGPNGPSKAKYTLADGNADRVRAASAEMLDANPLYPGLTL